MEMISGSHGVQNDVGEHTVIKPFQLNMIAEWREVAIQCGAAHLASSTPLPRGTSLAIVRPRGLFRHLHRSAALAAVAAVIVPLDGEALRVRWEWLRRRRFHGVYIQRCACIGGISMGNSKLGVHAMREIVRIECIWQCEERVEKKEKEEEIGNSKIAPRSCGIFREGPYFLLIFI